MEPSQKAMKLLLSWLNAKQKRDYIEHKYFYVIGSHTGMTYRINHAVAPFNVEQLHDDAPPLRLCFVPRRVSYPGDIMLAQKIGLETNEEHVLNIANIHTNWQVMAVDTPA